MRDIILTAFIFALLPTILKRPVRGVLMFTWISLMNPHRLCYGFAYSFPFAALIAAITLCSVVFSKERKRFPWTSVTVTLTLFLLWMTLTSFFPLEPDLVWKEWNRVMKAMLMIYLAALLIEQEKDIKAFAWIIGLSLGFYGFKGGIFTILGGGSNHVFGPEGSYIEDNNALALALVMTTPVIWYMQLQSTNKWMKRGLTLLVILTVTSAAGSYSRGALLAGGAMLFSLWLKSRAKLKTGVALVIMLPLVYFIMPDKWFERMHTINHYQQDGSAMGRINAWHFAMNLASQKFMGGGFNVFTPRQFLIYAPNPLDYHVAHSIYFQVLGDHGIVGLIIFLLLMFFAWRTASRIRKTCKDKPELKWAEELATMVQVSFIGYAVGGAFLSLPYFDLYYDLVILLVLVEKHLLLKYGTRKTVATIPDTPQPAAGNLI